MAKPIPPTPVLKGEDARKFMEAAYNPPKLARVKVLTRKQVDRILVDVEPKRKR